MGEGELLAAPLFLSFILDEKSLALSAKWV